MGRVQRGEQRVRHYQREAVDIDATVRLADSESVPLHFVPLWSGSLLTSIHSLCGRRRAQRPRVKDFVLSAADLGLSAAMEWQPSAYSEHLVTAFVCDSSVIRVRSTNGGPS
jgi:hypothetical protein